MRFTALAFASLILGSMAQADLKKDIQGRYDVMATALTHKDVKALDALHAKDFVDIDLDGKKTTSKVFATNMTSLFKSITIDTAKIVVNKATAKGTKAVIEATVTVQARQKGVDGKMSPQSTFKSQIRDTWIKEAGVWKLLEGRIIKRI